MPITKFAVAVAMLTVLSAPTLTQAQDVAKESPVDHSKLDHSKMEHSDMNHAEMDHSTHDMSHMQSKEMAKTLSADAPFITAKVNGLVCDFCAQALKKVFKKEEAVANLKVDLDAGDVIIILKPDGELDDARIKTLIRKSGYSLVSIDRSGGQ